MARITYSTASFSPIFSTLNKPPRPDTSTWLNIQALGIVRKTAYRGCRAGRNKQRRIKTVHTIEMPKNSDQFPGKFHHKTNSCTAMQISCSRYTKVSHSPWNSTTKTIVLRTITALCYEFHRQLIIANYALLENIDQKSIAGNRVLKNVNLIKAPPVKNQPKARFACWNARSINNKSTTITDFIICEKLDVLSLTETWLHGDNRDDRTIADITNALNDFNIIHASRKNSKGGGVAVIYRKNLTVTRNEDHNFNSMECLDLHITLGSKSLRHITIYRPPPSNKNGLTVKMFFDEFSNFVQSLMVSSCRCLITGDFNLHLNEDNNADAKHFLHLLNSGSFTQHVNTATHNKGHVLDLVITDSQNNIISNLKTVPELPSDHAALVFYVDFPRPAPSKCTIKRRNTRGIDIHAFSSDISDTQLIKNLSTDLNTAVSQYNSILRSLVDKHAPEKTREITIRPHSPWYSDILRALKRDKRRHERKWQSSGLEVHKQIYQHKACEYYTEINKVKESYFHEKISLSSQKQLFHLVDGFFTVKGNNIFPLHSDKRELADQFSRFFEEKISTLVDDLESPSEHLGNVDCHKFDTWHLSSSFNEFQPVTTESVRSIIMSSRSKSCTLDPLQTALLKTCIDSLADPITTITNLSLTQGLFPSAWKHGVVTPIIKKQNSDPNILKNYRPITNLSFLSKTVERIVCKQLQQYLQDNHLHSKMQSAYRSHHSTETALLRVYNDISIALDSHKEVVLILLDLTAAFDMVDHSILLQRLAVRYGLGNRVLDWARSYLSERTQAVKIDNQMSSSSPIHRGVPQGSVMGPTLFSLYVSPLENIVEEHGLSCAVYADDTQLYLTIDKSEHLTGLPSKLQHCITAILHWMKINKLVCNTSKTEVIHFSSKFINHQPLLNW